MAKVSFSAPIDEIRGRLGGLVYSANQSGAYCKPFSMPSRVLNSKTSYNESIFGTIPAVWRSLSDAQRADWATWAALPAQERTDSLGNPYYMTGWQAFLGVNMRGILTSGTPQYLAPTTPTPAAPTAVDYEAWWGASAPQSSYITYAVGSFPANHQLLLEASILYTPDSTVAYRGWRTILHDPSPLEDPYPNYFGYDQIAYFGYATPGSRLFTKSYVMTPEFVCSPPLLLNCIVQELP